MEAPGEWTSIAEASRRFGVTRRAIRDRIGRGTLTARQGNRAREVFVPADVVPVERPGIYQGGEGELRQRLAILETELAAAKAVAVAKEDAAERLIAELKADRDRLAELLQAALVPRSTWLERALRALRRG